MVINRIFKISLLISLLVSCNLKHGNDEKATIQAKDSMQLEKKEYDSSIYLGSIVGMDAAAYSKENTSNDTMFGLKPITESNYLVEIRFYTSPEAGYFTSPSFTSERYCTILYYDSSLKITRIMRQYHYDTITNKTSDPINKTITVKASADSILNKLVENGIFSLAATDKKDSTVATKDASKTDLRGHYENIFKGYHIPNVKELTKNGLKDGTYFGPISHPTTFVLKYKVGDIYNTIYMSNPDTYFRHNPDHQIYRRNYEIASLLFSGFEN